MLVFISSDSCVVLVSSSFSQLPWQVLVILGSSQGVKVQPPCKASQRLVLHHIHAYGSLFGLGLPLALLHSSINFIRRIVLIWEGIFSRRGIGAHA